MSALMTKLPRTVVNHAQRRLAGFQTPTHSPSELAIRSINEKRSTPRW